MRFFNKNKTTKADKVADVPTTNLELISINTNNFFVWNGKMYQSDIIRACIRPKVKAVGKLTPKHYIDSSDKSQTNSDAYMKFLLEEPNQLMTMQVLLEKVITQLELNSNAFIVIHRNKNGIPVELYPINAYSVIAKFDNQGFLFLEFKIANGKTVTYSYNDIIHLRKDFNSNDIFGDSPIETLKQVMEVINTPDQGIVGAIKNSSVIKWILEFKQILKEEDKKKAVKEFVNNYLNVENGEGGAIATDQKFTAKQVEPKDYVPNAPIMQSAITRLYNFYNTNEKIIQSKYNEDEWNAYYEAEIEPVLIQLSEEFTRKLFSRRQRFKGEVIMFESSNLQYASLSTKLQLVQVVDRGGLNVNEWRGLLGFGRIDGGDAYIRRLDTAVIKKGDGE